MTRGGENPDCSSSAPVGCEEDLSSGSSLFPEAEMSSEERLWRRIFDCPSPTLAQPGEE